MQRCALHSVENHQVLLPSNILNPYRSHTDWHNVSHYNYKGYACSILTDNKLDENKVKTQFLLKLLVIMITQLVHFRPVFATCAANLPCPFLFSLLAAASCSGLDMVVPLQKQSVFLEGL